MSRLKLCLSVAAVMALSAALAAWAGEPARTNWPVFRGNALETGAVPADALPDQLQELWKFSAKDAIDGAPAVVDGVVYFGSEDERLYAVDLATGAKKWEYKAGSIKASPAYRDGAVYVGDSNGLFHCVDAKSGQKRWTFTTGAEITSGANFAGDNILFGSYDETLYCLDKAGAKVWQFKTSGPVNGSAAVVGDRTFVAGCDSSLHVIDVKKGTEITAVDLGGQAAATAAVVGDKLYVGTMANEVQEVDWKKGELGWTFRPDKRAQPFYASAAVTDAVVVVGSRDKRVARPGPQNGPRDVVVPDGRTGGFVAGGGRRPGVRRLAGRQAVRAGPGQGRGADALRAGRRGDGVAGGGGGAAVRGHGDGDAVLLWGEEIVDKT